MNELSIEINRKEGLSKQSQQRAAATSTPITEISHQGIFLPFHTNISHSCLKLRKPIAISRVFAVPQRMLFLRTGPGPARWHHLCLTFSSGYTCGPKLASALAAKPEGLDEVKTSAFLGSYQVMAVPRHIKIQNTRPLLTTHRQVPVFPFCSSYS